MKTRTHVIMFQSRFADAVESGQKAQTIRPFRKIPIAVGDFLDLRAWTGKPYRSKQRNLRMVVCSAVRAIEIDAIIGLCWFQSPEYLLSKAEAERLAHKDGFRNCEEMIEWFDAMHGLPFMGNLITWTP